MALQSPTTGPASTAASTPAPAVDTAETKNAKKIAADKHREKIKAAKAQDQKNALAERDELQKMGVWEKLQQDTRDAILARCTPVTERAGHSGPSFFNQIFGATPKVGDSKTLEQIIAATYKGLDTMKVAVKKWGEKGNEIKVDEPAVGPDGKKNMLLTKYTIVKLAPAA